MEGATRPSLFAPCLLTLSIYNSYTFDKFYFWYIVPLARFLTWLVSMNEICWVLGGRPFRRNRRMACPISLLSFNVYSKIKLFGRWRLWGEPLPQLHLLLLQELHEEWGSYLLKLQLTTSINQRVQYTRCIKVRLRATYDDDFLNGGKSDDIDKLKNS